MLKKKISVSSIIITVIIIIAIGLLTYGIIKLIDGINKENHIDFWINTFVTLLSSILSAIVAYIVAMLQINIERKKQNEENNKRNIKKLNLVLVEMKDNTEIFNTVKKNNFPNGFKDSLNFQISQKLWNIECNEIEVSEDLLKTLYITNKNLNYFLSLDNVKFKENFLDFFTGYEQALNELKLYISKN